MIDQHHKPICTSAPVHSVANRLASTVTRTQIDGRIVYVKRYREGDWGKTQDIIQDQTLREAETLELLRDSRLFTGRLGFPQLVSVNPDSATLVTTEVPGKPLQEFLIRGFPQPTAVQNHLAMFLAGRWLSQFHRLPTKNQRGEAIGPNDPVDLTEYCDVRMRTVDALGYSWPTPSVRKKLRKLLDDHCSSANDADRQFLWSHSDYAPGNVLWDGQTLTGIDFGTAHLERPLLDVTYFIHRLEMLRIYFPWKRWPIDLWKRAFLRGYGRPDAEQSPMYRAMMIRHLLCRLQTYVRRPPNNLKQKLHAKWIRRCVRNRLLKELAFPLDAD